MGGNLADVLDGVGTHDPGAQHSCAARLTSLGAEGKLSAIILIALPFGVSPLLLVVNPTYMNKLFTHPVGWMMLIVAGAVMLSVGGLWLRKTVKIKF